MPMKSTKTFYLIHVYLCSWQILFTPFVRVNLNKQLHVLFDGIYKDPVFAEGDQKMLTTCVILSTPSRAIKNLINLYSSLFPNVCSLNLVTSLSLYSINLFFPRKIHQGGVLVDEVD